MTQARKRQVAGSRLAIDDTAIHGQTNGATVEPQPRRPWRVVRRHGVINITPYERRLTRITTA